MRFTKKSFKLFLGLLFIGVYKVCGQTLPSQPALTEIGVSEPTASMLELVGGTIGKTPKSFYVAYAKCPRHGEEGESGVGISRMDLDGKWNEVFWRTLPAGKGGIPPDRFEAFALMSDGAFVLVGKFNGPASSILVVDQHGHLTHEKQIEIPNATEFIVSGCAVTSSGDIYIVGQHDGSLESMLFSSDLKLIWRQPFSIKGKFAISKNCIYLANSHQFLFACELGTYSKFGMPKDGDGTIHVVSLDYEGKTADEFSVPGRQPRIAGEGNQTIVVYDSSFTDKSEFKLISLDVNLKEVNKWSIDNLAVPDGPIFQRVSLRLAPDGRMYIANVGWHETICVILSPTGHSILQTTLGYRQAGVPNSYFASDGSDTYLFCTDFRRKPGTKAGSQIVISKLPK